MIEPLDGKGLAEIRVAQLEIEAISGEIQDDPVNQLLALVDELREALRHAHYRNHEVRDSCTGCESNVKLLARTAPPVESRSVERRLAAQRKEPPNG